MVTSAKYDEMKRVIKPYQYRVTSWNEYDLRGHGDMLQEYQRLMFTYGSWARLVAYGNEPVNNMWLSLSQVGC